MSKFTSLLLFLLLLVSCTTRQKERYVIGVSSCSQDIWREKLNREMKTEAYLNPGVELRFAAANDNDAQQNRQIDSLVASGIDLLIVSPNQQGTITAAIERAYDKGIPVILFDRNAKTRKYTSYMGGDNEAIGSSMAQYVISKLQDHGVVAEISGLKGSTPAIERHDGFVKTLAAAPGITFVDRRWGDWTEKSGHAQMKEILKTHRDIDYVFCQNDRMAMGAYQATKEAGLAGRIKFTGVDALAVKGGGIALIQQGVIDASCLYPTNGDKVLQQALAILRHQPYKKKTLFKSAVVTKTNSEIIYNQAHDMELQATYLSKLHDQVDQGLARLSTQRLVSYLSIGVIVLLMIVIVGGWRMLINHIRMNDERAKLQQQQLDFFTNVSHQIRTPLTLIADPIHRIVEGLDNGNNLSDDDLCTLKAVDRNATQLMRLMGKILSPTLLNNPFSTLPNEEEGSNTPDSIDCSFGSISPSPIVERRGDTSGDVSSPLILIVEDNADIRGYEYVILKDHYRVIMAADGKQGLKLALQEVPDLIISDIMMPVMDGLTMCREVKNNAATSHIPVVLLTAKSREDQKAEGYESGADDYLTKPFSSRVLLSCIGNIFKGRERMRKRILSEMEKENQAGKKTDTGIKGVKNNALSEHDREFLEKLQASMQRRLADSGVSVEDIGTDVGFSRVQLYRKAKALTGHSPVELLRTLRLKTAKEMLETTGKSVSEVAYDTGFSSPSYFTKCYKDEFGVTPSARK